MKKNLLHYCWIENIDKLPMWFMWNYQLLKLYSNVFDGYKLIYVGVDTQPTKEFEDKVVQLFSFLDSSDTHLVLVKNNPHVRESEYFLPMLRKLKDNSDEVSMSFYSHTKGTSHAGESNPGRIASIKKWMTAMYFFNLGMVDESEQAIKMGNMFSGILRIAIPIGPLVVPWHYSGTFFWINNPVLFSTKNWDYHYVHRHSTESYPGYMCPDMNKSAVLKNLSFGYNANPYEPPVWDRILSPGFMEAETQQQFTRLEQSLCW